MRHFVRQSIKGGLVFAFNQYNKLKICGYVLKMLSREIIFEGNVYDNIEAYMKYKNDLLKIIKGEYESKFDEYTKIDEEETEIQINKTFGRTSYSSIFKTIKFN